MKRGVLVVLTLLTSLFTKAQWDSVGNGQPATVNALIEYKGMLYAGGRSVLACWDGQKWKSLGGIDGTVFAFAIYNNELYAGGAFDSIGTVEGNGLAKWDGSKWSVVDKDTKLGYVCALAVYNNELYAGGKFSNVSGMTHIGRWNGIKWQAVAKGVEDIWCLCVHNGILCMGGSIGYFALWNGTALIPAKDTYNHMADVEALAVYSDKLFGGFLQPSNEDNLSSQAVWNNGAWNPSAQLVNGYTYALLSYNSMLYAGGAFDMAGKDKASCIAAWNGSNWTTLGKGISGQIPGTELAVKTLAVYNGYLYVGGTFSMAGGIPVHNIARYKLAGK